MVYAVTATNPQGEKLRLELAHPEEHNIVITDISGLGPVKANVNISDSATIDGGAYNGSRLSSRNIVMMFDLSLAADAEFARHILYRYFPVKKQIYLDIETVERKLRAIGVIESNEPNIFSNQETVQVSMLCADPYLYSTAGGQTTIFSGIDPLFEFKFPADDSTLVDKSGWDLLEFGEILHKQENTVNYQGDVDTGVIITIHALNPVKNITIYNSRTREFIKIKTDYIEALTGVAYNAGDDIIINTKRRQKSVELLRAGITYNILNSMTRDSSWLQLQKGDNVFAYNAEEGAIELQFKIDNDVVYHGI